MNYFYISLHAAYAQAKELALAQRSVPLLTAGSLQTEQRAGGRFVYRYRYAARIELAAVPEAGLLGLLEQTGLPFHEVPTLKRGGPSTSYRVRGRNLKVDLLAPARGKPYVPIAAPELGAHAMSLPYLEYLLRDTTTAMLIGRDRMAPVTVPHAGWF